MTQDDTDPGREALTPRQREIAGLVARGCTNQQIASELFISQGTAANHVQEIRTRLGLSSRTELAMWASQHGLATTQNRMLTTLERLLAIDARDLDVALDAATQAVAEALDAEKVDAFLYDESTTTLVARGTSPTPLGRKQHALGLHLLPLANGGRMVEVFETGVPRQCGRVDLDAQELRGIRKGLGVRSEISVPLELAGKRAGVVAAVSTAPDFFSEADLRFLTTVARWVGTVAHRVQLTQAAAAEAAAMGRRTAAEELITILAHDFRNFLAPLRGRLEVLGRRARREGHERYLRDSEELVRTVDRLDRLVRDLLDTARLEQGLFTVSLQPVDLVALVRQTIADLARGEGSVEIRAAHDELVVFADPLRLRQALENLLSNAFKVQPAGEAVVVELDDRESCATVTIQDRGPGIPADLLPRLFQRFGRGAGSAGLGLGLYLARGVAEAHAGSIEVDAPPGRGARFTLRLPLEPVTLAHESPPKARRGQHRPPGSDISDDG
jgi:two-component system OmpR family sensor kinase